MLAFRISSVRSGIHLQGYTPKLGAYETMGISYDDGTFDSLAASDTVCANTGLPYGPAPLPKETAPGKVIPMPQRKVI